MKVYIVNQILIEAKRSEIFQYLANPNYHFLWNPTLKRISTYDNLQKGSTYKATNHVMGIELITTNVITKFKKNEEVEIVNKSGIIQYRLNFKLLKKGAKVLLINSSELSTISKLFAFSVPVFHLLAKRQLQTQLNALKIAVEHSLEYEPKIRKIKG